MKKCFIADNSEFRADNMPSMVNFLKEREANSKWYTDEEETHANRIRFYPIFGEPICVPTNVSELKSKKVFKFTASEDAYSDTMDCADYGYNGTTQMMFVNGDLHPVGNSAIKGLIKRAGLEINGWDRLRKDSPQKLSDVLNNCYSAIEKGYTTILVQDEKVRAVNSGRYTICPMSFVAEETVKWMENNYPDAIFAYGYINHDYAEWTINLSKYTDAILKNYPEIKNNGFEPAVIIRASNTGSSSVSLNPAFKLGNSYYPLSVSIDCVHSVTGSSSSERTIQMKSIVKDNFGKVFQVLDKNLQEIEALKNITVKNAYNALLRAMKSLGIPKKQGMEAAEIFKAIYGDLPATAFDCYISLADAYGFVCRDFPKDYRKQFEAGEAMVRCNRIRWKELGEIPGDFSW